MAHCEKHCFSQSAMMVSEDNIVVTLGVFGFSSFVYLVFCVSAFSFSSFNVFFALNESVRFLWCLPSYVLLFLLPSSFLILLLGSSSFLLFCWLSSLRRSSLSPPPFNLISLPSFLVPAFLLLKLLSSLPYKLICHFLN